ncbi:Scarecrow-like protein 1 [Linum perenne]
MSTRTLSLSFLGSSKLTLQLLLCCLYQSVDVTFPRESQDKINVERQCLARDIVNVVASEGEDRIEWYEVAGKWRARMMMAGFASHLMDTTVMDTLGNTIYMNTIYVMITVLVIVQH